MAAKRKRRCRNRLYLLSVVGGQDYPSRKVVASMCGAKAAEKAVRSVFAGHAPYHYWTGAVQVCLTRWHKDEGPVRAAERIPDRCYALTPRGRLTRV